MEKNESTFLSFKGYEIVKLNMTKVKNDMSKSADNIGFLYKIIPNKKDKTYDKVNVIQGVRIGSSQEFPYDLEVVLKGNFKLESDSNNSKIELIKTNASAILFPYLRATVSLLTSQLEYEKIILPVMNFTKVLDKADIKDLFVDHTEFEDFTD